MAIDRASDCTIKRFMQAWFDNKRDDIDFESIHLEYVDLSGIGKTAQLELEARVQWINNRVERVKMLVYAERTAVIELGKPFDAGIQDLRSMNHKIYWDGDANLFMDFLRRIETKEKKYIIQLEEAQAALKDFLANQNAGAPQTSIQSKHTFIMNMNMLRKEGYPINVNETMLDEYSLMIKAHNEEIERQNQKK